MMAIVAPTMAGASVPSAINRLAETISQYDASLTDKSIEHRRQVTCLAVAVYHESRGESVRGQRAVASVVMNRTRSGLYPNTPCGVVYQRSQFSNIQSQTNPRGTQWAQAVAIASEFVESGRSENPFLSFRRWMRGINGLRIGNHIFHRSM